MFKRTKYFSGASSLVPTGMFFFAALLVGCGADKAEWTEEVQLLNGTTLVVNRQAYKDKNGFPHEHGRLKGQRFEYKPLNLTWQGDTYHQPVLFEIQNGTPYLMIYGGQPSCLNNPENKYPFIYLKWNQKSWVKVTEQDFLNHRFNLNLYQSYWGNRSRDDAKGLVTLAKKKDTYPYLNTTLQVYLRQSSAC